MNCLCCGKEFDENNKTGWHKSCIKKFFGTYDLPEIHIDKQTLETFIDKVSEKGITVTGVQKKLSLQIDKSGNKPRLTIIDYPTGYILKPQVEEYISLPESEHLIMTMAEKTGISTVMHALIIGDKGQYEYITKRIDRESRKEGIKKLAMEDFCQLSLRLTEDKYKGSYEQCAKIIKKYSSQLFLDMSELFLRLLFCFVTGNSDMHLKNFSLIRDEEQKAYHLSPAYDLLPVNIILPEDTEELALTINGKKNNIRKKDFLVFSENCGISDIVANRLIQKVIDMKDIYVDMVEKSFLCDEYKDRLTDLITLRIDRLAN